MTTKLTELSQTPQDMSLWEYMEQDSHLEIINTQRTKES
jgi:hypothetical protein